VGGHKAASGQVALGMSRPVFRLVVSHYRPGLVVLMPCDPFPGPFSGPRPAKCFHKMLSNTTAMTVLLAFLHAIALDFISTFRAHAGHVTPQIVAAFHTQTSTCATAPASDRKHQPNQQQNKWWGRQHRQHRQRDEEESPTRFLR
jgi:hypothetical protein